MSEQLDISKLLDEELKKIGYYYYPTTKHDHHKERMKLVATISDEIFSRVRGRRSGIIIFKGLLGLLNTLEIEPFWADEIFNLIQNKLTFEQEGFPPEQEGYRRCENLIFEVKLTAIDYYKRLIYQEFKEEDLPKKLKKVKINLSEVFTDKYTFRKEALIDVQKELEQEIELQKKESLNRQELEASNSTDSEKVILEKHKDITIDRATLFLSYLLDFANEKRRENFGLKNKKPLKDADKDRAIDFLTPFTGKQSKKLHKGFKDEIAKIAEEKDEVSEKFNKFYNDVKIIRNYFEMLGLSEIVNRIDSDLGEK